MAKTPVDVDEDVIRDMVKGDIPRLSTPKVSKPEPDVPATPVVEPTNEAAKPRRRKEPKDYASEFLRRREPLQRRQTYISVAHFTKITEILAVVANQISVPVFLDNLLDHHLEYYKDEINGLYADKFEKPLK